MSGSLKAGNVSGSDKAGNASGSVLEMRQAQVKTVKEMWYHHGSKPGSHLGLREVMLWPGSLAAAQDTCQADLRLETCQAHIRLETRQAQCWKCVRLSAGNASGSSQNGKGDVVPPWQ